MNSTKTYLLTYKVQYNADGILPKHHVNILACASVVLSNAAHQYN